ncbi:MAG: NAD(P)H-hydrate dehydratase [Neomegalonema sp.]|nr:NAD(P)H-hydrate dehydratase [Neomegalonema sp.]
MRKNFGSSNWAKARRSLSLLDEPGVAALDAAAMACGASDDALMAAAGEALAAAALARFGQHAGRVVILAGPGKNGGDGYVAARALARSGRDVLVYALGGAEQGAAAEARRAWSNAGGALQTMPARLAEDAAFLDGAGFVIDALFGVGLSRPMTGIAAELAQACAQRCSLPVISADLPSGLCARSGRVWGAAFQADLTVSFEQKRIGHLLADGLTLCGELEIAPIIARAGAEPEACLPANAPFEVDPSAFAHRLGYRALAGHKFSAGHVLVASGGLGASGAARLAARAALRSGAGLVTLLAPQSAMAECAAQLTAIMLRRADDAAGLAQVLCDARINALVLGPGLDCGAELHPGTRSERARPAVLAALASDAYRSRQRRVVLDADALTCWGEDPAPLFDALRGGDAVLTPHLGEFAALFPDLARRLRAASVSEEPFLGPPVSRLDIALEAAERAGAVIVLKGPDTVIAAPGGEAAIHAATRERAAPHLATAGSGDVLAGLIAGLAAQGNSAFDSAALAVWLHGALGRHLGAGLIAEDLPEAIPPVLAALRETSDR